MRTANLTLSASQNPTAYPPPATPPYGQASESHQSIGRAVQTLWSQYAQARGHRSRTSLILGSLPLVRFVASRYLGREPFDDLVQIGTIGLIKAVDQFDPSQPASFTTYAMQKIVGEIKHYLRDNSNAIRIPRRLQEISPKVQKTKELLTVQLGRCPTVEEIARALQVSEEDILEASQLGQVLQTSSLDAPLPSGDGGSEATLGELLGAIDPDLQKLELYADLQYCLAQLEERERAVISGRFIDELPQAKLADKLGISQMHVSRLEKQTLCKLRAMLHETKPAALPPPPPKRRRTRKPTLH